MRSGKRTTRVPPADPGEIELTYTHSGTWVEDDPLIRWDVSADVVDESGDRISHVGHILAVVTDLFGGVDTMRALDEESGDLSSIAAAVIDPDTELGLAPELERGVGVGLGEDLLIIDSVALAEQWRGFGIGVVLTGVVIQTLSRGAGLVALTVNQDSHAEAAKLGQVWRQLGFEHLRDHVYVLNPSMKTLDERTQALRAALKE